MSYLDRMPYPLRENPTWVDFANALDTVYSNYITSPIQQLASFYDADVIPPGTNITGEVVDPAVSSLAPSGLPWVDIAYRIYLARMLGCNFEYLMELSYTSINTLINSISMYYSEAGTPAWYEYVGYLTSTIIQVTTLWATVDPAHATYINYQPEGSSSIGTSIVEGGTWYPTSTVNLTIINSDYSNSIDFNYLVALINFFAPINLIVNTIQTNFSIAYIETEYISMAGFMTVEWSN